MAEQPDEFQISLRILGNEIIGLQLNSSSKTRAWAAFGIIATAVMVTLLVDAIPLIQELGGL